MNITIDSENFMNAIEKKKADMSLIEKAIRLCCEKVRSTSLKSMSDTPRNNNVTYHGNHHPSLPGNPPAPDTGNLRASVHYTIETSGQTIIGRVGTDVEYGKMLEYGTSKIAPRPWLKPALDNNKDFIEKTIRGVMKK